MVFGTFQVFLSIRTFKDFRRFNRSQLDYEHLSDDEACGARMARERTANYFPWSGFASGLTAVVGWVMALSIVSEAAFPAVFSVLMNLSVLGVAVSLASLLSRFGRKRLSIPGLIFSLITLTPFVISVFLG